ncbi:hypothetical protein [Niastella populi]|uniref:hypothetical protein n=1 Tax=Niastella populi TaxID=550983 RepID=UPI0013FD3AF0|nr:hypothetical protein [Niastella populi]
MLRRKDSRQLLKDLSINDEDSFTVSKFSGKHRADVARQAGCRYMVVTSRLSYI